MCAEESETASPPVDADLLADCQTLLEAREALGGEAILNWDKAVSLEEWRGVEFGGDPYRVVGLNLSLRGLTGVIPDELGELTALETLNLSHNQLTGDIPGELGGLTAAQVVRLDGNELSGSIPVAFGNLVNLSMLHLGQNQLEGEIPQELGQLANLRQLRLGDNILTGEIPSSLGGLAHLEALDIGRNQLVGAIPDELGELTALETLNLSHNRLTGDIPGELGRLTAAQVVRLDVNRLSGSIPAAFGSLVNLSVLNLGQNHLDGEIPHELGQLANLRQLHLGDNVLTGEIPSSLGGLAHLETLDLGRNQLVGVIPDELGELVDLQRLFLGENSLRGTLPDELAFLTSLRTFYINSNALAGCIPDEIRDIDWKVGAMQFCGDLPPVYEGGIDLGATYIERLPRYQRYKVAYFMHGDCPYQFDQFKGATVCPEQAGIKRWPDPGDPIELVAHVRNFGDTASGPFDYEWKMNEESVASGRHEGLRPGEHITLVFSIEWPGDATNPVVRFDVDTEDEISELVEDNNSIVDWIKGYSLGIAFTPGAYESLRLSADLPGGIQSPEQWMHGHVIELNAMLAEAGLKDRVRAELFAISDREITPPQHELGWYMDGWWTIRDPADSHFSVQNYERRPTIDWGLIHELLHQLGVIDIYNMHLSTDQVLVPDANRPGYMAGCGTYYWPGHGDYVCFRFPYEIEDIMSSLNSRFVSPHTAGGLKANTGYRRGFYGDYLYDTPGRTVLRVVDPDGGTLPDVALRLYQLETRIGDHVVDAVPEIVLITDGSGLAILPNRGITGIVTETGHQLRPNPFGVIDVVGNNGIFLIEMDGQCINYHWLTIVDLNLLYWKGSTDEAVITKTLQCPPRMKPTPDQVKRGPAIIHSVSPGSPSCILRDSPHRRERLLTIMGENFGSVGNSHLQFRLVDQGVDSIHFGLEVEWDTSRVAKVDIGRIQGVFENMDRQLVMVRVTDASYKPLSDWSDAFIVATNASAC